MASKRLTQNFVQTVKPPKTGQLEYFDNHPQGGSVDQRIGYGGKKAVPQRKRPPRRVAVCIVAKLFP